MLQTNVSGYPVDVMTDPPFEVPAGGTVDFPTPLAGFEPAQPAEDDGDETGGDGDGDEPERPARQRRSR